MPQAHGELHSETIACLSWIAETHQKQAQYSEAETILTQVVWLNRQLLGDQHPGVADSLSDLAELLRAQGKLDEVKGGFTQLPDFCEKFLLSRKKRRKEDSNS